MELRVISCGLLMALCGALVGCGGGKGPPKGPVSNVSTLPQIRKEMIDIATKIEDPGTVESLEAYLKRFEEEKWGWSDLNEIVLRGNFNAATKDAYERWRNAKIADDKWRQQAPPPAK